MARKKVTAPKLHAERVKLDRGGYVRKGQAYAGRYFGVGEKLWRVTDDETLDEFVRAATKGYTARCSSTRVLPIANDPSLVHRVRLVQSRIRARCHRAFRSDRRTCVRRVRAMLAANRALRRHVSE